MMTQKLSQYFKGRNFVTPQIIGYGEKGKLAYELSRGKGIFDHNPLFGLTVVDKETRETLQDKSSVFHSADELNKAVESL